MPPDQQLASSAMERLVVQEIGVKLTGILKENTPGRICGLLTARGRSSEWETALEHIGEHFGPLPASRSIPSLAASCATRYPQGLHQARCVRAKRVADVEADRRTGAPYWQALPAHRSSDHKILVVAGGERLPPVAGGREKECTL
jgi:hypothetical protein